MLQYLKNKMYYPRRKNGRKLLLQCGMGISVVVLILLSFRFYTELVGYMPSEPLGTISRDYDKYITKYENNYWKNTTVKKIMIWTPFFGGWGWYDDARNAIKSCDNICVVTNDKSEFESSDAILFHASDMWKQKGFVGTVKNFDIKVPKKRTPNQVYAVLSMEPIFLYWGNMKPDFFNWTLYHRRESTIYMPFTDLRKKTKVEMEKNDKETSDNKVEKSTESINYFATKTKFASTLVSNCKDQAKRYRIIRELKKYVDVDDFGHCSGNLLCDAGDPTEICAKKYLTHYKFYLAFENSFCRDYISEKFWNALHRRQIPVIAAPKYNLEMIPPNSYLNVFDFPSIKALADRMIEISENEALYNSYFVWVKDYRMDPEPVYCKVCRELHANHPAQSYTDMEGWLRDDICYKATPWSLATGLFDRLLFDIGLS